MLNRPIGSAGILPASFAPTPTCRLEAGATRSQSHFAVYATPRCIGNSPPI
jgi:hypothetical protein